MTTVARRDNPRHFPEVQAAEARFVSPKTGETKKQAYATGSTTQLDLSGLSFMANYYDGNNFIVMILTTECQIAFGDTPVTIATDDPAFPAGFYSFIPRGKHVGLQATTSAGSAYFYPGS